MYTEEPSNFTTELENFLTEKQNNMKIQTATVTQTANEILGKKESHLHYLIIENKKGEKYTLNVGEKTKKAVEELIKNDK